MSRNFTSVDSASFHSVLDRKLFSISEKRYYKVSCDIGNIRKNSLSHQTCKCFRRITTGIILICIYSIYSLFFWFTCQWFICSCKILGRLVNAPITSFTTLIKKATLSNWHKTQGKQKKIIRNSSENTCSKGYLKQFNLKPCFAIVASKVIEIVHQAKSVNQYRLFKQMFDWWILFKQVL